MFKKVVAVFVLICICFSVSALDMTKAEPYKEIEFPKIAHQLRRAEIVFFGALPLAFPATNLAMSAFKTQTDFWGTLGIACGVAGAVALTDFIIGIVTAD